MYVLELFESGLVEKFVPGTYLIVVVGMLLLGTYLKKTKWLKDELIPVVLILVSFVLIVLLDSSSLMNVGLPVILNKLVNMLMIAIIIGTSAVGNHQAWFKQLMKGLNNSKR